MRNRGVRRSRAHLPVGGATVGGFSCPDAGPCVGKSGRKALFPGSPAGAAPAFPSPADHVAHSNEVLCSISSMVVSPSKTFFRPS
jgi:hypothetical protein